MGEDNYPPQKKWEGKVQSPVNSVMPEEAWSLIIPFGNLHELLPTVETCRLEEGELGKPGCVRYCATTIPLPPGTVPATPKLSWAKERLLKVDPEGRWLKYVVVESNMGFTGTFEATLAVVGVGGGGGGREEGAVPADTGCALEWTFAGDPVEGWTLEELVGFFGAGATAMAGSIQEIVKSGRAAA